MKLDAKGFNEHGVLMCECKRYGPPHAYEPGEWCSPVHVLPKAGQTKDHTPPYQGVAGEEEMNDE